VTPPKTSPVTSIAPWALVALGLALYLPALGTEVLRHPLEAKYALAAREMLRGGPLLVAHLFGEVYPDKPPLYFWATAALGWLNGGQITELIARLPAVAGAVLALVLTYRLGTTLFGQAAGLLGAAVLATSNLFFWYARQGHPDQFMVAAVTLACLAWWRSQRPEAPDARPAPRWIALAYAAMALGVMSKGLVALVLPLLASAAFLAVTGRRRGLPRALGLWPGLGVFVLVVLAWYGPAVVREGPGYAYETVIHQQLVRYTRSWVHHGPWYYYLKEFPAGFFPWVLFLPGAVVLARRARLGAFAFPLCWFVAGFVFFSLSTSKRSAYLLPIYPAAALMVGWLLARAALGRERTSWVGVPVGLGAAAAVALAALLLLPGRWALGNQADTLVPSGPAAVAAAVALLVAGATLTWLPWRRGRPEITVATLLSIQVVAMLVVAVIRAPQYEARFPVRVFAGRVQAAVAPGEPIHSLLGDYDFVVAFYVDRPLVPLAGPGELRAARAAGHARFALVDGRRADVLAEPGMRRLAETRLGPKPVVLVGLDGVSP
jgi:4-amino-4-deoxy-L-arabinose transferase-like glycosyltransferase